ncbi:DUF4912 domain-containing protein [Brevibacillus fluminis]|uniref:DUF4912 domain-containing protein n=1 Tax=Brevibacillus fluminis TaxID=511487 RepID=A0A3M8DW11_9BACL|nr:DUF4912 domain-containing protein [Brevibacillus fluminis]RNB91177.1 DUF4912 domain-containing protein [Brevibacillus fluminis]
MMTDRNPKWDTVPLDEQPHIQAMLVYQRAAATLYVRWKMSQTRMRMVASYLEADERCIKQGLRLYDATDSLDRQTIRDFMINESSAGANAKEISEIVENRIYIVDYGFFHQDKFYPILRSEPIAVNAM